MIKLLQWLFEGGLLILLIILVYSQIVLPLVKNTPVFPMFRRRPDIKHEIEQTNEALEENELQRTLAAKKKRLQRSASQTATPSK